LSAHKSYPAELASEPFCLEQAKSANDHLNTGFELEPPSTPAPLPQQGELYLPESGNPEQPETTPQLELNGMSKPA